MQGQCPLQKKKLQQSKKVDEFIFVLVSKNICYFTYPEIFLTKYLTIRIKKIELKIAQDIKKHDLNVYLAHKQTYK